MDATLATPTVSSHRVRTDVQGEGDPKTGETPDSRLIITPARLRAFISNIEKPAGEDGCWLWRGALNGSGYASGGSSHPAYRVAYEWLVGPIPSGCQIDHLCRTPACVNPHHLEPVTHSENLKRVRRYGPFELRRYCRRGHALVGKNKRIWSDGTRGGRRIYCYACHDGERYGQ